MNKRKLINDQVVEWIENRTKTKYPQDISLVLLYGSYMNGTANELSDVDCYFIPETEKGYEMAVDFILEGVGYDVFPMDWDRVKRIAELKESLLPCVGDVQILYCRSEDDLKNFEQLQRKMQKNLQDEAYIAHIIKDRWLKACHMYSEMKSNAESKEIRKRAGVILMTLAEIIAFYNHDYFHFGLKKQYEDLQCRFSKVPQSFVEGYAGVVQSVNDMEYIERCFALLKITADYLDLKMQINAVPSQKQVPQNIRPDYDWLAGLYEEISSTFNKIYICCENHNYILAFLSAVCLQWDLDDAAWHGGRIYDLLEAYHDKDLNKLSAKAKSIEVDYVEHLSKGNADVKKYDSFEEFIRADL